MIIIDHTFFLLSWFLRELSRISSSSSIYRYLPYSQSAFSGRFFSLLLFTTGAIFIVGGPIAIGFFTGALMVVVVVVVEGALVVVGVNEGAGCILTGPLRNFWYLMRMVFHSATFDSASRDYSSFLYLIWVRPYRFQRNSLMLGLRLSGAHILKSLPCSLTRYSASLRWSMMVILLTLKFHSLRLFLMKRSMNCRMLSSLLLATYYRQNYSLISFRSWQCHTTQSRVSTPRSIQPPSCRLLSSTRFTAGLTWGLVSKERSFLPPFFATLPLADSGMLSPLMGMVKSTTSLPCRTPLVSFG